MRLGVTYDLRTDYLAKGMSEEDSAEFDAEITIASLCQALTSLGHDPIRIGNIRALTEKLVAGERWDAVFNICEGIAGYAREAQVPALLEAYRVPFVFSDPLTLAVALDKAWSKRIVGSLDVPTAPFAVIECSSDTSGISLPYPLFLKPLAEGSGKGINARSRVTNAAEMHAIANQLLVRFRQPVLVETYLPGREFTVGITGTANDSSVLGVLEIAPTENAQGTDYGYENKERCNENILYRLATDGDAEAAADVALQAWRALRCRDAGRVDVRNDAAGRPQFVEVNPLAGLNPEHSDLCFLATYKGLRYRDLIGLIMDSFLRRHPELAVRAAA